jgi:phosphatidylserine/phosphatidylglycerophosphate/cardiolipin synthase-like enzyme
MARAMLRPIGAALLIALAAQVAACGVSGAPVQTSSATRSGMAAKAHLPGELQLFVLPEATDAPILQAIANAKKSVKVQVYLLTHTGLMDALVAAKARGLDVQVMLESRPYNPGNPNSPLPTNKKAAAYLAKGGIEVRWTSDAFRYTHAKGLIVDDSVVYVSTANFTKSGLGVGGVGAREYIIADRSPSDVAEFVAMYKADWAHQPYMPTDEDLIVSPANSRAKILNLVKSATREIVLQVEVAGDPAFDQAISERIQAGVKVRALLGDLKTLKGMEPKEGEAQRAARGNAEVARAWKALGAQVRFQGAPHLHAKAIVVDGKAMYLGSVNLTTNSMDNNRELGLLITTPALVGTVARTIEKDWAGGHEAPTKQ